MATFVVVKYGDDKKELFNPDCRNSALLNNIKERCDCDEEDVVDVSDQQGSLKNLLRHPLDYATKYLRDREVLILIKVDKSDDSVTCTPLLDGMEADPEFMDRLNPPAPVIKEHRGVDKESPRDLLGPRASIVGRSKRASISVRGSRNTLGVSGVNQGRNASPSGAKKSGRIRSNSIAVRPMNR